MQWDGTSDEEVLDHLCSTEFLNNPGETVYSLSLHFAVLVIELV